MNVEREREKERQLSCFFCRELLPLYLEERLDVHRKHQIETHVKGCSACRHLFDKMTASQNILRELSLTKPTASLVNYIRKEQSFWAETFQQMGWRQWPSTLQWAVQLSLVAVILVTGIHFFPWLTVARKLHQIQRDAAPSLTITPPNLTASDDDAAKIPEDNVGSGPEVGLAKAAPGAAAGDTDDEDKQTYGPVIPQALRQVTEKTSIQAAATGAAGAVVPVVEAAADNAKPDASKMAGFVWKGTLKVDDISDDLANRVTKAITDLGGIKAGQVELGWHRGNQRYYHFILPDDNYDRLLSALNREGIVALNKEAHPRVIKQGHRRIIMTIEQNE